MDNVADILDAAADELECNGHTKNDLGTPDGPKCVTGAVFHVTNLDITDVPNVQGAFKALGDYLDLPKRHEWGGLELLEWNNAPERTAEEVIDAMRNTAKELRNNV